MSNEHLKSKDGDNYFMFKVIKKNTIIAAKDLKYDECVIEKLEKACSENELTTIMMNARKRG